MIEVKGDLITFRDCEVIVQQLNCLTTRAHGLSAVIARRLGYDPYAQRASKCNNNIADEKDRPVPGTIDVVPLKDGRHACGFFAQFMPGSPQRRYAKFMAIARQYDDMCDDAEQREMWFQQCLDALGAVMKQSGWTRVAFPFRIGCGLAGGDWDRYKALIEKWECTMQFQVTIVKLK